MTTGQDTKNRRNYTLTWLPWVLGIAAFALYLVTINHSISFLQDWTSFFGMSPSAARLAGWTFEPEFLSPVHYIVTYPIRWLPQQLIPFGANLFSAICGALVIIQLCRSVALLPHDRTRSQREREDSEHSLLSIPTAWLPPLLAALVCGLQLTFWEHSTNGTMEMFDLLLFSYVVRSILEFRVHQREGQLFRAAFVYGAAITNNYAMIGFFPLFLFSLVWTRKIAFFNLRFLGRMALCGLAGLLFYLLQPAIDSHSGNHSLTFWQLLQANVLRQQSLLLSFPRTTILLLSLTSILPVFLLSIRWSSQFGDPSRIGVILTTVIFHISHIVILLGCLWMMLDPAFSPRKSGFGILAFLPFYYLGALSIGYYAGYLLLVSRAIGNRLQKTQAWATTLQHVATTLMLLLLVVIPTAQINRNLPEIRLTNSILRKAFAEDLVRGLPKSGIVISDNSRLLMIAQDWLTHQGRARDYTFLCSEWLPVPDYHDHLKKIYPKWTSPVDNRKDAKRLPVSDNTLAEMMQKLAKENEITYLHPSFGYYFETFAATPNGLTLSLTSHKDTSLIPPPPAPETVKRNEEFWNSARNGILKILLPITMPPDTLVKSSKIEQIYKDIKFIREQNAEALFLGTMYSRSLVNWAVELQKTGDYDTAVKHLQLARELNPDNVAADANLSFNKKFRAGDIPPIEIIKSAEDWFGKSRSWDEALSRYGPFDEPSRAYAQGYIFAQGGLTRQAAQVFDRVRTFSTNDIASRLWLGQLNLNRNFPDRTLELVREIREIAERIPGLKTNVTGLFAMEASAYFAKKDAATATIVIETNLALHPDNSELLMAACKTYSDNGHTANALDITERMLRITPDEPSCLLNKGCFMVELTNYIGAIEAFDRLISIETNNYTAILYRAIAGLRAERFDAAEKDYELIQRQFPKAFQVYYGLGEIAYRRKDTNTAIRNYEYYLTNAPPKTVEATMVAERINELKGRKIEKSK